MSRTARGIGYMKKQHAKRQMTNDEIDKICEDALQIAVQLMNFVYKNGDNVLAVPMGFLIAAMITFDFTTPTPDQETWNKFSDIWPSRDEIRQRLWLGNVQLDAETKH